MSKTVERLTVGMHTRMMVVLIKEGELESVVSKELSAEAHNPDKWEHVLRWNYPTKTRIHEADMIINARKVLKAVDDNLAGSSRRSSKKYADSLPRVFDHLKIDDRDKLSRAFLEPNNYGERVLRFIISERLEPITSLTDLEEFKTAFRDIFHVIHYLAISKDGIKHRDISISNLMCRRLGDGSVQGILNDWDVASTSHTESDSEHTNMRTGTMPFMSIDLHRKLPPVNIERFEYESLFYVLYWICLSYSYGKLLPEEKRHSAFKRWLRWNSNDHDDVRSAKVDLLNDETIFEDVDKFPAIIFLFPTAGYELVISLLTATVKNLILLSSRLSFSAISKSLTDLTLLHNDGPRKYGFHGLSYSFTLRKVAAFLKKPDDKTSIIVMHLGSGASVCAIKDGRSIDTSMGLTPLDGLSGATRSGHFDSSLTFHYTSEASRLSRSAAATVEITDAEEILNT
ncbi:acetate kinase [Pyrrhoderma noxium]|uniref:Acetate kinase n=1 Tax=Pyrrhoderma noxium TaxID=2282107 RepID=A0A286UIL6_9AGAM|nr:acetate kinase [Pyrrhoderma noxium]